MTSFRSAAKRYNTPEAELLRAYEASKHVCILTGIEMESEDSTSPLYRTVEKIKPHANGGKNEISNFGFSAKLANDKSSNATVEEFKNRFNKAVVANNVNKLAALINMKGVA